MGFSHLYYAQGDGDFRKCKANNVWQCYTIPQSSSELGRKQHYVLLQTSLLLQIS